MPYELENRLVIGVASSAVFDLVASDAVFQSQGEEEYRKFGTRCDVERVPGMLGVATDSNEV